MSNYKPHVNSVSKEASRVIHLEVMKAVSDIVMQTAGPRGSTTMIMQGNAYPLYTKDGKKVLEHIDVFGEIERGILDQLIQITEKVVSRVGDGTTSAVCLAYLIFKEMVRVEKENLLDMNTYDIIRSFQTATKLIQEEIKNNGREMKIEDVYDICMISTNGDTVLSRWIQDAYEKYGKDVYIDLKSSTTADFMTKEYDGLTINKGYSSPAFINRSNEICELRNPRIYVFKDPVDTPEMIGFFTRILYDNIITPYMNQQEIRKLEQNPMLAKKYTDAELDAIGNNSQPVSTLIMCPFMSRDLSTTLEQLETVLYQYDKDEALRVQKLPICIVTNLSAEVDELSDISILAGCKVIGKYIDESVQKADIKAGKAPTIETVTEFYGSAEQVIIDKEKSKFINPMNMFDNDDGGNRIYSTTYESLVSFLKGQLKEAKANGDSPVEINRLKRRLTGLTSALVELYVGGISVTDRESAKDLADDAVRNCRSAAMNGVGMAANFEGLMASMSNNVREKCTERDLLFVDIIKNSYMQVIRDLYSKSIPANMVDKELEESIKRGRPLNLRTLNYDNKVLTSIDSDIAILDCISRIVTIMFTSNQILIKSAFENSYANITDEDNE